MKNYLNYNLVLFLISLILCSSLSSKVQLGSKLKQLTYQDQFENCQREYQELHKSMREKVQYFTDNEEKMLNSVKDTVLTLYSKSEKFTEFYAEQVTLLNKKLEMCNTESADLKINNEKTKENFEAQLKEQKNEINGKNSEIEMLKSNYQRIETELANEKKVSNELKSKSDEVVVEYENKINSLNEKLKAFEEQIVKFNEIIKEKESIFTKEKNDFQSKTLEFKAQIIKAQEETNSLLLSTKTSQEDFSKNLNSLNEDVSSLVKDKTINSDSSSPQQASSRISDNRNMQSKLSNINRIDSDIGTNIPKLIEKSSLILNSQFGNEIESSTKIIPQQYNQVTLLNASKKEKDNTSFIENTINKLKKIFQPIRFKQVNQENGSIISTEQSSSAEKSDNSIEIKFNFEEESTKLSLKINGLEDSNKGLLVEINNQLTGFKSLLSAIKDNIQLLNKQVSASRLKSTENVELTNLKQELAELHMKNTSLKEALAELELKSRINKINKHLN